MTDSEDAMELLFNDNRVNAAVAWLVVGVLALSLVESLLVRDLQWLVFTAAVAGIVLVPPVAHRSPLVMLPWELLVVAALPVLVRTLSISVLANTFATYLSIAALALVVTVQLHLLTGMNVTHWFAIVLVVMATLAAAGLWTIVRWNLDAVAGTSYLSTNEALMWEYLWVTAAGLAGGVLFDLYFRPRTRAIRRRIGGVVRR